MRKMEVETVRKMIRDREKEELYKPARVDIDKFFDYANVFWIGFISALIAVLIVK